MGTDILVDEKNQGGNLRRILRKKGDLGVEAPHNFSRCIVTTLTHNALLLLEDSEHYVVEG